MEEDIEMQIEQLRANRGRDRDKKAAEVDDILFFDDEEKPLKKDDGIMGVLLFQCIVAVILAITFVLAMTFSRPVADDIKSVIIDKSQNDFSFKDKVYSGVSDALTYLNKLQPIEIEDIQTDATIPNEETDAIPQESATEAEAISEPTSEPEAKEGDITAQGGAGGEPNPVSDGEIPANATFAPVIFTGAITFPIKKNYRISSSFGFRDNPTSGGDEFHTALDIAADKGTPIMAAASGTVIKSEKGASLGNYIIIDHSNGFLTVYGHCDKLIAKEGARIREGEIIARVGSTGASTGNHLHFGMKKDGLYFDPQYIFKEEAKSDD